MMGTLRQGAFDSFFDVFVELNLRIGSGGPTVPIELVSMQLVGGGLPPAVRIRKSPTLVSGGATSVQDLRGGTYRIDSFFDVFVELSVDNGQSWTPGTRNGSPGSLSMHLTSNPVPEPATLILAGAALAASVRRKRKTL